MEKKIERNPNIAPSDMGAQNKQQESVKLIRRVSIKKDDLLNDDKMKYLEKIYIETFFHTDGTPRAI